MSQLDMISAESKFKFLAMLLGAALVLSPCTTFSSAIILSLITWTFSSSPHNLLPLLFFPLFKNFPELCPQTNLPRHHSHFIQIHPDKSHSIACPKTTKSLTVKLSFAIFFCLATEYYALLCHIFCLYFFPLLLLCLDFKLTEAKIYIFIL